ncbi:MAG TPA: hypothetical protein PKC27_03725 [Methanomethylovorans sp.]|nr:hypothetical protein [Methanomethylovorans sp.]
MQKQVLIPVALLIAVIIRSSGRKYHYQKGANASQKILDPSHNREWWQFKSSTKEEQKALQNIKTTEINT